MRSDMLDVAPARIGRGVVRTERQNLGWATCYFVLALPFAAGVFEPSFGPVLRPEIAAITMAGSSALFGVNALTLKWLRLPHSTPVNPAETPSSDCSRASAGVSAVTERR